MFVFKIHTCHIGKTNKVFVDVQFCLYCLSPRDSNDILFITESWSGSQSTTTTFLSLLSFISRVTEAHTTLECFPSLSERALFVVQFKSTIILDATTAARAATIESFFYVVLQSKWFRSKQGW